MEPFSFPWHVVVDPNDRACFQFPAPTTKQQGKRLVLNHGGITERNGTISRDSKRIIRIVRESIGRLSHYKPPSPLLCLTSLLLLMATGTQWSVNHKLTTGKKNIQAVKTAVSLDHVDLFVIKISCIRQLPKMSCCTHIRKQQDSQFSQLKSNYNETKSLPNNLIVFLSPPINHETISGSKFA